MLHVCPVFCCLFFLSRRSFTVMFSIIVYMMFEFAHWIGSMFANIVSGYCFIVRVRVCGWALCLYVCDWKSIYTIYWKHTKTQAKNQHLQQAHTHARKRRIKQKNCVADAIIIGKIEKGFWVNVRLKIEREHGIANVVGTEYNFQYDTLYECAAAPGACRLVQCSIVFTEIERVLTVSIYS